MNSSFNKREINTYSNNVPYLGPEYFVIDNIHSMLKGWHDVFCIFSLRDWHDMFCIFSFRESNRVVPVIACYALSLNTGH